MIDGSIPEHMTGQRVDVFDTTATDGLVQFGKPLTPHFVRWLGDALDGWGQDQLELQLEDLDWRAHRAWQLHRVGHSAAVIARDPGLQCSERTVARLLATARRVLHLDEGLPDPAELTYEQRLRALRRHAPRAFHVYIMTGCEWRQETIAGLLDLSESTVKRDLQDAREYVGDYDRRMMRRVAATLVGQAELTDSQRRARRQELIEVNTSAATVRNAWQTEHAAAAA